MVSNAFIQPQPQPQPQPQLPSQPQLQPQPPSTSAASLSSAYFPPLYKNLLLVHTSRANIPQPIYQTMCEGPSNAPRFWSSVKVDGALYTSPNIFLRKKDAEQDAARVALERLSMRSNASPPPVQLSVPPPPQPQPSSTSADLPPIYKNLLLVHTQRLSIPQPIYRTISEGPSHELRFKSTVEVDGATYTSPNIFLQKKAAEQDIAKVALEHLSKRIRDERCPLIYEDTLFCKVFYKAILNEFALKMNLDKPTFSTVQQEKLLPVFISSLVFNGVCYSGTHGQNKKEAEQLAARAVIISLLGNSESGTILTEIIKSKEKLYAAMHEVESASHATISAIPQSVQVQVASPGASSGTQVFQEQKIPEPPTQSISAQTSSQAVNLGIEFVPAVLLEPSGVGPSSSKKHRKNKNKANKKIQADTQGAKKYKREV